ncbi:MAG: TRM11 family methyltransferase [Candidatus Bathyarchaeia archaeon]
MAKLFFLLSGEHETLPSSEVEAILAAENYAFKVLEKLDQVLRVEADLKCVRSVEARAALTRVCGLEQFACQAEPSQIVKAARFMNINEMLLRGESFAVRVKHIKSHARIVDGMALERRLGELILNMADGAKVNLRNPDKTFIGVFTDEKFVFGLMLAQVSPRQFMERRPRKKPFFHPSAMPPKLARCMVNLTKPKLGDIFLDPFCGTGSLLVEAGLIGCRVLGVDIQKRMVKGSLKNLKHFDVRPEGLIVADARRPPVKSVDCIATDPPYGRSASTFRLSIRLIIEESLKAAYEMLGRGKRLCIAAPKTVGVGGIGISLGYKHLESHPVYIHRGLTREIALFEKV